MLRGLRILLGQQRMDVATWHFEAEEVYIKDRKPL